MTFNTVNLTTITNNDTLVSKQNSRHKTKTFNFNTLKYFNVFIRVDCKEERQILIKNQGIMLNS